ncbi:Apolipoprotein M [Merluccius polli]|uniref:Apolipoprotein M n=1 Tax=Merluccius polli TaxID=89951 RepID=A0AA47NAN8_MERPO|nr:Apolipoprotein M [Merluccius polli]
MQTELASLLLYVYSLWSAVIQPCPNYTPLSVGSLSAKQYLGRWYFSAAVSRREEDLQLFRKMDSTVFTLQTTASDPDTLLLTGDMRIGQNCVRASWTYNIISGRDDMQLQGRPDRQTFLRSGAQLNCSDCIILQEVEPALNRYMLYGRQQVIPEDVIEDFREMFTCHRVNSFVRLPQNKGLCLGDKEER